MIYRDKGRVLGNRVLRRILGPKWDEVTERLRKLHNKVLRSTHSTAGHTGFKQENGDESDH
jgi:DNA-binding ferritin-like protein